VIDAVSRLQLLHILATAMPNLSMVGGIILAACLLIDEYKRKKFHTISDMNYGIITIRIAVNIILNLLT